MSPTDVRMSNNVHIETNKKRVKNLLILRELTITHKHIQQHSSRFTIRILTSLRNTGVQTLKNHMREYIKYNNINNQLDTTMTIY